MIGHPVAHSLSPAIHAAAFAATGLDWTFVAFDVAPADGPLAVDAMRRLGIAGMSVTTPHKESVISALDELTPAARALGAVNCISWNGERLVGDNTDGDGLLLSLRHDLAIDVAGRRCAVLGAGGAARSVIAALVAAGADDVVVVNRSHDRAVTAAAVGGARARVGTAADVEAASLVINATTVGMGTPDRPDASMPISPDTVHAGAFAVDLVYHPLETPWLAALRSRGVDASNGLGMLVGQAALAFRRWTSLDAPYDAMSAAAAESLHREARRA